MKRAEDSGRPMIGKVGEEILISQNEEGQVYVRQFDGGKLVAAMDPQ
jgi:hypothetical protein